MKLLYSVIQALSIKPHVFIEKINSLKIKNLSKRRAAVKKTFLAIPLYIDSPAIKCSSKYRQVQREQGNYLDSSNVQERQVLLYKFLSASAFSCYYNPLSEIASTSSANDENYSK